MTERIERIASWLEDAATDGLTSASRGDQHNFRVAATTLRTIEKDRTRLVEALRDMIPETVLEGSREAIAATNAHALLRDLGSRSDNMIDDLRAENERLRALVAEALQGCGQQVWNPKARAALAKVKP